MTLRHPVRSNTYILQCMTDVQSNLRPHFFPLSLQFSFFSSLSSYSIFFLSLFIFHFFPLSLDFSFFPSLSSFFIFFLSLFLILSPSHTLSHTHRSPRHRGQTHHLRQISKKKQTQLLKKKMTMMISSKKSGTIRQETCLSAKESYIFAKEEEIVVLWRGGGLGSSTIFKKFHEPYAPS